MKIQNIAEIAHETNRGFCLAFGDTSQMPWDKAPDNIKQSAIDGVVYLRDNPNAKPSDSHDNWLKFKREDGWRYGPVKDLEKREHPCFVPYNELPTEQKAKDYVYSYLVKSLLKYLD